MLERVVAGFHACHTQPDTDTRPGCDETKSQQQLFLPPQREERLHLTFGCAECKESMEIGVGAGLRARPRAAGLPNCFRLCGYWKIRTAETCVRVVLCFTAGASPRPTVCAYFSIFLHRRDVCPCRTELGRALKSRPYGCMDLFSSQPGRVSLPGCVAAGASPRPTVCAYFSIFLHSRNVCPCRTAFRAARRFPAPVFRVPACPRFSAKSF